ncbi:hydantoinase/oxoprolinase family protein [Desulfopila aestuarii]|uniref:N-methylhydantoinase A/oxoprolinase/acetone carboxylase, beta subunit n=1 Tax=Desulfopila aestuarii DSM 18488 TaxID=1121416 RepID=A0A1M7YF33_9BACT|nr:hydantoinase/oxoprolinase family protein [Desulfopila aestuarii]SHO51223.1 N-methylhydantoinase A/oxoprolinase/acetone carboxylase, beta subunit [Desulfopila aestuarii DSM 18488]
MIIGLDVGGTHTDAVLIGAEGMVRDIKVNTDPERLYETVMSALDRLLAGQEVADVKRVVLSTTLATNMVVQDKLPPVAMVVSAGPGIDPEHFRVGSHYFRVKGALDHSGRELEPVREKEIHALGAELKKLGLPAVGVVSKFSVRNAAHELAIARILESYVDKIFMGHLCSGALSFPRRIATTYLNAAVYPVHTNFFTAVHSSLAKKGISHPIRILKPDGGNMNMSSSLTYPAQTILSGPSASVMGAIAHAPKDKTCLVLDIGGTTTDMAIILNGAPVIAQNGIEIGSYKTLIRALLTKSIGIGGDSVVRVREGKLAIGPDRGGAAMAHGGPQPTPTDAMCVLGMIEQGDRDKAAAGLAVISAELGLAVIEAAEQILHTACENIMRAADEMVDQINSRPVYTVHEMCEGVKIRPDYLLVLGGPAGQFAGRLAEMFKGEVEIVPNWRVANAIGCALARTTCEVTVYADTARRVITAQGEEYHREISRTFTLDDARKVAFELVRKKAAARGANEEHLKMEVLEESQFNMIRRFSTVGKNIRVRAQVKPGLIHGYDAESGTLNRADL